MLLTSIRNNLNPTWHTKARSNLTDSNLATWAKVLSKSIPLTCVYPWATNPALFLITLPNSSDLFLKIYLVPITLVFSGLGTRFQTLFHENCSSSSCIAFIQNSSSRDSFTFFWFIKGNKTNIFNMIYKPLPSDHALIGIPNNQI